MGTKEKYISFQPIQHRKLRGGEKEKKMALKLGRESI
jgi:hypothetical protein